MGAKSYRELIVWQKAMDLVEEIYQLTKLLPRDELYGMVNQMRRAVVSIPSNIAEGNSRHTSQDYIRFLSIARGSMAEVETQLEICVRLKYISAEQAVRALRLCAEVGKLLNSIIQKLIPNP
jgi:four helix bundle protein